jgi:carbamoyltransferase
MKVLGIHDGHNSSVCLMDNGKIIYLGQEERFTYNKNQGGFPVNAIAYIKKNFGYDDIDKIVMVGSYMGQYDWSREAVVNSYAHSDSFKNKVKQKIKSNKFIYSLYQKKANTRRMSIIGKYFDESKVEFIDHHLCHASTAYYARGEYNKKILVITADGEGDNRSGSVYIGDNGSMSELMSLPLQDSIGRLYSYYTYLYNMVPYEHEYKIMGLAPYCNDKTRIKTCKKKLYKIINFENSTSLSWKYLGNLPSIQSAGKELRDIFDVTRFDVMAAALQEITEELLKEWILRLVKYTKIYDLALSGGVFMNVKANMILANIPEVKSIYVVPSCGDESNVLGAAYFTHFFHTQKTPEKLENYYFGNDISIDLPSLEKLEEKNIKIQKFDNIEKEVAELLARGEIVGRVKGKMEFGARSLGNRAILGNPSVDGVLRKINEMIKGRDFWMPFAPSVLYEDLDKYFIIEKSVVDWEYMIFTAESLLEKRAYAKSALHPYDYTGRPQGVKKEDNPDYYKLLQEYKSITGESLILNTSYNLHGFPMVQDQEQSIHVLLNSGLEYLALGNYLLSKT